MTLTRQDFTRSTPEAQEILRKFVDNHVILNQTSLVCKLQQLSYNGDVDFDIENEVTDNSERIAELEYEKEIKMEELRECATSQEQYEEWEDDRDACKDDDALAIRSEIEKIDEELSDLESENGEINEVYERWLVDSWLLGQLKDRGQVVADCEGEQRWGRQTCGQAILLDYIIGEIYCDYMNIE